MVNVRAGSMVVTVERKFGVSAAPRAVPAPTPAGADAEPMAPA